MSFSLLYRKAERKSIKKAVLHKITGDSDCKTHFSKIQHAKISIRNLHRNSTGNLYDLRIDFHRTYLGRFIWWSMFQLLTLLFPTNITNQNFNSQFAQYFCFYIMQIAN